MLYPAIYDRLETSNRPGRGRFEAFHRSCSQLPTIKWEKLMVSLASMVMKIFITQRIECKHTRNMRSMVSKNAFCMKITSIGLKRFDIPNEESSWPKQKLLCPRENSSFSCYVSIKIPFQIPRNSYTVLQ